MSSYDELLNRIKEYLNREEIVENKETISALKLFNTLDEYLSSLKNLFEEKTKSFSNQLNEKYNNQKELLVNLFKEYNNKNCTEYECVIYPKDNNSIINIILKDKETHKRKNNISIGLDEKRDELYIDYNHLEYECEIYSQNDELILKISLKNKETNEAKQYVSIKLEEEDNEIYIADNQGIDKKILEENYETILNLLTKAYKYKDYILSFKGQSKLHELKFSDDLLDLIFYCYKSGNLEGSYSVKNDKDKISYRKYIEKESIQEYIEKNMDDILKRISINIDSLEEPFKSIVKNSLEKNDAKVIKPNIPLDAKK